MVISILVAVFVFGIIIFVHELGHFIAARLMGVKVNEFAMGMGPKVLRIQGKETLYSLRAFPIGGFCAMEGEDSAAISDRSFGSKKVWRRFIILVSGALMNLVLGFALLLIYCPVHTNMPVASAQEAYFSMTVAAFRENASSETSGLQLGDKILSINGKGTVNFFEAFTVMTSDEDGILSMKVQRMVDGKKQTVSLDRVKLSMKTDETTGEASPYLDFQVKGEKKTVLSTISEAAKMELAVGRLIWRSLVDIFTGKFGINDLSGPVGIVGVINDAVGNVQQNGWQQISVFLMLTVMITVNVGIFNLLPLPALDGGRIIFLIYELIFRHPVNPKYEGVVHAVGLMLFFLLTIAITFKDIFVLVSG